MIIHKLIAHHLRYQDDAEFYRLQARDAVRWIGSKGVAFDRTLQVLDLGCGHGVFGAELLKLGCSVVFADEENQLLPGLSQEKFIRINIDQEPLSKVGRHDLVICSNVLEHLAAPERFIGAVSSILSPGGRLYLSWTNWLSPWGGHEFSPFHYLGPRRGHLVFDRVMKRRRKHTPFVNLFPTYIGSVLAQIRGGKDLAVVAMAPRYFTEFAFLMRVPWLREFLTWNAGLLLARTGAAPL